MQSLITVITGEAWRVKKLLKRKKVNISVASRKEYII